MWSVGVTGSLCNSWCVVIANHIHNVSYKAYLLVVNTIQIRSFCSQVSLGREDELTGFCVFIFLVVLAQRCTHIYYLAVAEMLQS